MGLALAALALLAIGCISLFLSMVRDSIREIAIKMALGANNLTLMTRIAAQGTFLTLAGVLVGIGVARALADHIADQLYRTESTDPITFAGTAGIVVAIGTISVLWSAVKATRTDPATSLRTD
jgi:ABC-type antimicrobial peptide transport system permease subunit